MGGQCPRDSELRAQIFCSMAAEGGCESVGGRTDPTLMGLSTAVPLRSRLGAAILRPGIVKSCDNEPVQVRGSEYESQLR